VEALMSVTPYFKISRRDAAKILSEVSAAVSRWRDEGKALGISKAELDQFAPAFEHDERKHAARVR
jgi:hypothetical protein